MWTGRWTDMTKLKGTFHSYTWMHLKAYIMTLNKTVQSHTWQKTAGKK
jgi:flagellar biosynthesis chaperone FliJ